MLYYWEKCFYLSKIPASVTIGQRVGVMGIWEKSMDDEILEPEKVLFARDLF